jgi:molecular chaperone GrpE
MNVEIKQHGLGAHAPEAENADDSPAEASNTKRIRDLQQELAQMRDRWMRAEAEIANVRSRARRDVDEAKQFAVQKFAVDVVEAADNLHRGVDSLPDRSTHEPQILSRLRDGFSGIERSFLALLERNGIARHDPTGAAFDAGLHQAMDKQQTTKHPPGTILQAWSPAWTLNGRLLRPAMVVVATAPGGHTTQASSGAQS